MLLWDGIMHVNPHGKTKALLMLYNPLKEKITRTIKLPLYYSGITGTALIREQEAAAKSYKLNRGYEVELTFTIAAESYTWFVVE